MKTRCYYRIYTIMLAVLMLLPIGSLFSFDWGGSVTTSTTLRSVGDDSDEEIFANTEQFTFYLNTPLGTKYRLESQAAARFDAEPLLFAADVERLYLQRVRRPGQGAMSEFVTRTGRQTISDPAGVVVRHVVDGLGVIVRYPRVEVGLSAGYTGFVNKEFSSASISLHDSLDADDDDVYFGPPRLIGQGRVALNNIFAGQNIRGAFIFQEDLRDPDEVVQVGEERPELLEAGRELGGLIDTQYVVLALDGPIPTGSMPGQLFYQAAYVLNLGRTLSLVDDEAAIAGESYQYKPIRAHLARLNFQYFLPRALSTAAGAGVTFSSGDDSYTSFTEGNVSEVATMYTPVTPAGSGAVFGMTHGNATIVEIFYSLKPLERMRSPFLNTMQAQLAGYSFFRSAGSGPVSVADVDGETDEAYLGSEVDLALRFRPYSDFGFGLTGGVLVANDAAMADGANSVDYIVRLDASLSF